MSTYPLKCLNREIWQRVLELREELQDVDAPTMGNDDVFRLAELKTLESISRMIDRVDIELSLPRDA